MDLTVPNMYGLLIRSKLLSLDECRDMYARWNQEAKENTTNVGMFARWIVANRFVTEYQASLLARGHADGFFLNGYKILDRLGKGRMAGVYRAQHETGPIVAIKVLPPSKARDHSLLARFRRESEVAQRLRHPNIVRTFQVGTARQGESGDRLHYLVMEYLDGETLEDALQRRRQFPPGEAARLVHQALLGLQHLHEKGLVHRDLKPSNLMLSYAAGTPNPAPDTLRATLKILDMGLARTLSDEVVADPDRTEQIQLTSEGVVLGTPDYMSPEQARDARTADIRSDIYSLGCVLYHLLDGRPPFPDTNIISQMIRHATEAPRPLRESNPAVPDGLQQIVNWMLAKDPAQRYPNPERAARALQMFLAAGAEPPPTPESDPRMKKYLTFLEIDVSESAKRDRPRGERPSSGSIPAPQHPTAAQQKAVDQQRLRSSSRRKEKRKKKTRHDGKPPEPAPAPRNPPSPLPAAVPAPPLPGVDVELVALPPPVAPAPPPPQKLFSLPLTRRDMVMFGIGVGTVTLGTLVGAGIAALFGAFRKDAKRPDTLQE